MENDKSAPEQESPLARGDIGQGQTVEDDADGGEVEANPAFGQDSPLARGDVGDSQVVDPDDESSA